MAQAHDLVLDEHAPALRAHPHRALALRGLLVCVAYYLSSVLGHALIAPSSSFSVLWLPNTVLLTALLLSPPRQWPGLVLIALPAHLLALAHQGVGLFQAGTYYVFGCALVVTVAAAMRRFGPDDLALRDLRQTLAFIAVTISATALGSLIWSPLIVSLWFGGNLWTQWYLAFLSNLLPFLIAMPCLAMGLTHGGELMRTAKRKRVVEFGLLVLGLLACAIAVFGLNARAVENFPALLYAPIPFLLWAAVRFGSSGLSLCYSMFAALAIFSAVSGHGPLVSDSTGQNALGLQTFMVALYAPLLVLAGLIEERSGKEKTLRESEAHYRAVVEDQTELICRFLPDGTYTFVNGAYCRYFHTSPEALLGHRFWTFIPPEGHQAAREFLESITPEHPVATREHEVVGADGELRWQQWRDRGFFDEHGRVVEYQAVGRDITERKHLEEAMQNLAHVGRLAVVGELTGSIAHEISQPLTAILANAEAGDLQLRAASPSLEELRAILADIRDADLRASEVIQRVRALLRKRELVMCALNLNAVVEEVVLLISNDARRRKVTLATKLASELVDIRGDRVHLQQVLLNLVLNGMEAMAETAEAQRRIVIRTERDGDQGVKVSVADAGDGIPAERLAHVFESFYTTKAHGMGLGLAICRSIVDVHGGHIWAENNPGGGATFCLTLPAAADNAPY
jgi:PAS domain S-box-containing protein